MNLNRIHLKSIVNIRDLGGIKNKDGLEIKKELLIRSGKLNNVSKKEIKVLYDKYQVRQVIDLRLDSELIEKPDKRYKDIDYKHIGVMADSNSLSHDEKARKQRYKYIENIRANFRDAKSKALEHMSFFYRDLVNSYSLSQYKIFIQELLQEDKATLWHCSLGKDRAGIATVILLELLDVDRQTIYDDYLYSSSCLFKEDTPLDSIEGCFYYAQKEYLDAFYDEINKDYGNLENMFKKIGFSKEMKQALKNKYLVHTINVESEIAPLRKVMLHRPGKELLALAKDNIHNYLYDDIPNLECAQKEHDIFAKKLKENNVSVLYIENLMSEVLIDNPKLKEAFIKKIMANNNVTDIKIYDYLMNFKNNKKLVNRCICGIKKNNKYVISPMINLLFQRDSHMCIGNAFCINNMASQIRRSETILDEFIFKYHKDYKNTPIIDIRNNGFNIEGGDILNLSKNLVAIGISQRTQEEAVSYLAKELFSKTDIKTVIGIEIPKNRASMHLDTVLTQVDYDKFIIYPKAFNTAKITIINKDGKEDKQTSLKETLKKYLNLDSITFIKCENDLEQWNDGANTLTIRPGKVIVYKCNKEINQKMIDNKIEVIEIEAKQLGVGRGGCHCMSQPLSRY